MRKVLVVLPLMSWLGCQSASSGNCTVAKDAVTGVATISCPDGSSVEVAPGQNGKDGSNGEKGDKGEPGANGANGTDCSVSYNIDAGTTVVACADGTMATLVSGVDGLSPTVTAVGSQGESGNCVGVGGVKVQLATGTPVYVCNGAAGPPGDAGTPGANGSDGLSPTVTAVGPLGEAGSCVGVGGLRVQVGTGTPVYVCNGAAGPAGDAGVAGESAVVTSLPFSGEDGNCVCRGGVKVQVGVGAPTYVCNGDTGLHDGGNGVCVAKGVCSAGHHDGGDGVCVLLGACSVGYFGINCEMVGISLGVASGGDWSYAFVAPDTSVDVASFKLDKSEVTVAQYAACVTSGQCTAPNMGGACNWQVVSRDNHPINCVDWSQATAYCAWAGKRLPTELEWQWAASNAGTTTYPWGETTPDDTHAQWSGVTGKSGTAEVGSHPAGNTSVGLQDMAGNVWEWTESDYNATTKSIRGGSWFNEYLPGAAYRFNIEPDVRYIDIGFRCAQ